MRAYSWLTNKTFKQLYSKNTATHSLILGLTLLHSTFYINKQTCISALQLWFILVCSKRHEKLPLSSPSWSQVGLTRQPGPDTCLFSLNQHCPASQNPVSPSPPSYGLSNVQKKHHIQQQNSINIIK